MDSFVLWARYNRTMNQKLYALSQGLQQEQLDEDRGAFFGSIYRTLNHIMIADVYWLGRISGERFTLLDATGEPVSIRAIDQILFDDLDTLSHWRARIDDRTVDCMEQMAAQATDLNRTLDHRLMTGELVQFSLNKALCHWFNHQTHHRGQITTLLSQMQIDIGITDLLLLDLD